MKKLRFIRKTAVAVTMTAVLVVIGGFGSVQPWTVLADETLPKIGVTDLDGTFDYVEGAASESSGKAVLQTTENLPSAYDLRDYNCVPSVKLQNPWGTCWAFASIAAAEISILSEEGSDPSEMDLSERHTAWFGKNHINDENSTQNGEGAWYTQVTGSESMESGVAYISGGIFASGMGVVDENAEIEGETPFLYKGKQGRICGHKRDPVTTNRINYESLEACMEAGDTPLCYANDDDWSIDESLRFSQSYALEEANYLPDIAPDYDADTNTYSLNEDGIAAVKEQIVNYGRGVEVSFHADSASPDQNSGATARYMNTTNWAHFTWESGVNANHAVCIVGYDDDYPASNFTITNPAVFDSKGNPIYIKDGVELTNNASGFPLDPDTGEPILDTSDLEVKTETGTYTPEGNGAWIVRNSWGSSDNEFPNKDAWGIDGSGYFYISYYDRSISKAESYDFIVGEQEESEYNYSYVDQYDFLTTTVVYPITDTNLTMGANQFTADADMKITSVSCQTTKPGTHVKYELYLLGEDAETPTDGTLVATEEAVYTYGGFHRQKLEEGVNVRAGQRYSVVVTQSLPMEDGSTLYLQGINTNYSKKFYEEYGQNCYYVGVINEGESLLYSYDQGSSTGSWSDLTAIVAQLDVVMGGQLVYDNLPIKTYAEPTSVFTVTFDTNGHGTAPETQSVFAGEKVTEPQVPTAEGLAFGGWFTDQACTQAYDFSSPVTANLTLYAGWVPASLKIEITSSSIVLGNAPDNLVLTIGKGIDGFGLDNFDSEKGVYVDGIAISPENYTAEQGSIIISLKKSFLDTLKVGEHTVKVCLKDSGTVKGVTESVQTTLSVVEKETPSSTTTPTGGDTTKNVNTGDDSNAILYVLMIVLAAAVITVAFYMKNRRRG